MWPEDLEESHEDQLASGVLGRRAKGQLHALKALIGHPMTHAELARAIQGSGSRATVANTVNALRQKGLIRTGLLPDLKTATYELTRLGTRVLLVAHEQNPYRPV
jgi:hypothetical protein